MAGSFYICTQQFLKAATVSDKTMGGLFHPWFPMFAVRKVLADTLIR
nr:MAG TPA: hypothetical protein [Caudoviricetes sp.]